MKKLIALTLALISLLSLTAALAENNAAMYRELLDAKEEWTCVNFAYNPVATIRPSEWTVFGDETGEVWMVQTSGYSRVYRMWFTPDGLLVLTRFYIPSSGDYPERAYIYQ